ncbi:MAG: SDR family NAD(P)-dependent oxidoreductase [Candidatus Berkelbacteria bacterium]|nr:SDR family NAD(P)-dependent oxidoreductase [Candidatus Berkelbacteria bacterium]
MKHQDSKPKSQILITGAAGFIGSHVSKMLLEEGREVVCVDNFNDYYDPKLKDYRAEEIQEKYRTKVLRIDIRDVAKLETLFSEHKFTAVIHLAGMAGVRYSMENPNLYFEVNTIGTLNILEMMRKYDVPKIVIASTSSLYAGGEMPFSEKLPVNTPISPYAASKKGAEVIAYTYHHLYDIDVTVVRYFTVFGPAGRPDMSYFRFIKAVDEGKPIELFGDGMQTRDFTYVSDIASGTIRAMKKVGYEIVNLGGGKKPISINYMINLIEKLLQKKALINQKDSNKADMDSTSADISKASKLLDWQPLVDFEDGIKACVNWYKGNKEF